MSPGGSSERLTSGQTSTVFTDNWGVDGYEMLQIWTNPSNYTLWAEAEGITGGPTEDEDGDGVINVLEFMLGMDGDTPDPGMMPAPVWTPGGLTWTLTKNPDALDDGLGYGIEVSNDAVTWVPAGSPGSPSNVVTDNSTELTVSLDPGESACFMRISVDIHEEFQGGVASFIPRELLTQLEGAPARQISACATTGCGCRSLDH